MLGGVEMADERRPRRASAGSTGTRGGRSRASRSARAKPSSRSPDADPFERYAGHAAGSPAHPRPLVIAANGSQDGFSVSRPAPAGPPAPFGETGLSARVTGRDQLAPAILVLPFAAGALKGVDLLSIRVFSVGARGAGLKPVWQSGVNTALGFVWARLPGPGSYRAIGLPRDLLLREALRDMARKRRYLNVETAEESAQITSDALALLREAPAGELQELRQMLTYVEAQAGSRAFSEAELQRTHGFHLAPFPLPGARTLREFRELVAGLETPPGGFPEEELFFDPALLDDPAPPWPDQGALPFPLPLQHWHWPWPVELPDCFRSWSESKDWWMYHHDERHTGHASGASGIRSTTVGSLSLTAYRRGGRPGHHHSDGGRRQGLCRIERCDRRRWHALQDRSGIGCCRSHVPGPGPLPGLLARHRRIARRRAR